MINKNSNAQNAEQVFVLGAEKNGTKIKPVNRLWRLNFKAGALKRITFLSVLIAGQEFRRLQVAI